MALSSDLRSALEKAVVAARDAAEEASRAALGVLAVDADRAPDHFDEESKRLRVALRADARQLGGFELLVEECAYEQWHRMLFARFLAENDLLIHPKHGVAVTLDECEEIAHARGGTDLWLVASEFASAMLPGIFRSDDPVLQLTLAPEGQQCLEEILAGIPPEVFTSDDGLGWVYQYWQSKKKKEVNASERKIGGADIAPVTQLFTENYMVRFLLENTLAAWWASRHPQSRLVKEWEHLRFNEDGEPAAGSFPGWPETVAEVTVMDPCCGSGHFLTVAFEMLRAMRVEAEGLSAAEAGDAVLRDNVFGLEIDPRCTQIAAFSLALQAWKTGGYRELPIPNIACSGISAKGRLEDWKKLARGDERLERSLERLHALFSDAADLGSLIDPLREMDGDLLAAQFDEVAPVLDDALHRESAVDPSAAVFGNAAIGAFRAASLLARRYTLVTTNPPFLGRGKQIENLKSFCELRYQKSKSDLATVFLERGLAGCATGGVASFVTPQNWLFLDSYESLRRVFIQDRTPLLIAKLGEGGFASTSAAGAFTALVIAGVDNPLPDHTFRMLDVSEQPGPQRKGQALCSAATVSVSRLELSQNPSAVIASLTMGQSKPLRDFASVHAGSQPGQTARVSRAFWELPENRQSEWAFMESTPDGIAPFSGKSEVCRTLAYLEREGITERVIRGRSAWGKRGVLVSKVRDLKAAVYLGEFFDDNVYVLVPKETADYGALYAFCTSPEFAQRARELNQKLNVTVGTLESIPFEASKWRSAAAQHFADGPPRPGSGDPTQWLFTGAPRGSTSPLQIGVARLVSYRWPRQTGFKFSECPALGPDGLESFADDDGIVCISSVRGERPAAERLRALLAAAFGEEWSPAKEADLLAEVGYAGKSLEQWLREGFYEQHCQLFHQRPFVWQIWDGMKDGFSAIVNYHRLDRPNLEKLAYTYLGQWIRQQREAATGGTPGADLRLAAAEDLKRKLELILEGEDPYDIFVRWKPLEEQPLGWEPDPSDGVRLNIRPFVTAGVLRKNPKIKWGKDRGKDPDSAPWYPVFKGDRINDHHLTLADKRVAREAAERRAAAS